MSAMMTGLLLMGFLATEVVVVATSDHIAQALVRPTIGDAVYAGPPVAHPEEPDSTKLSETELLRLAAGYQDAAPQP